MKEIVIRVDRKTYSPEYKVAEIVSNVIEEAKLEYNESYVVIVQIKKVDEVV